MGRAPTVVSALLAIVIAAHRGRGLSSVVLDAMKTVAGRTRARGPDRARPSHAQGTIPAHPDGALRPVGARRRATLRSLAQGPPQARRAISRGRARSMVIDGNDLGVGGVDGHAFPRERAYVVPGALQPVVMDLERDLGIYTEPNVWMRHPVAEGDLMLRGEKVTLRAVEQEDQETPLAVLERSRGRARRWRRPAAAASLERLRARFDREASAKVPATRPTSS